MFPKGALLKDPQGILVRQTENVQLPRQIRFTSVEQIEEMLPIIKAYIHEAFEVEKSGLEPDVQRTEIPVPEELQRKLEEVPGLKTAFESLTPGRQRGYLLYFTSAKRPQTREARAEKHIPHILSGTGMND